MIWDSYTNKISDYYLSALINNDYLDMPDYERRKFEAWKMTIEQEARDAGWTVGRWTTDHEGGCEDWGKCAVSNLLAMRATVTLMVYKGLA